MFITDHPPRHAVDRGTECIIETGECLLVAVGHPFEDGIEINGSLVLGSSEALWRDAHEPTDVQGAHETPKGGDVTTGVLGSGIRIDRPY